MHTALYTLFHHIAGNAVRLVHIAGEVIIVCTASAAANEFGKAAFAVLTRKKTVGGELFADLPVESAVVHVAHKKIFIAGKLVTGINVAVRHDGKIFVAGTAGGNFLLQAYPTFQIYIEMEKVKAFALFVFIQILVAQYFVLVEDTRKMLCLY